MKNVSIFKKTILASSIALLTACGGSGSSGDDSSTGTTKTVGVITGFGSVYVNGIKFETDNASFSIDGSSAIETNLGVGDVIELEGTVNADGMTGTATAIRCDDELEGYVLDVSGIGGDGTGTMNVMGQTVTVTADTVFDGASGESIADVMVNDIVEVSGFSDGSGNVVATRIETKDADEDVEVKGLISDLDTGAMTFMLGTLTVDYSAASEVPENMADGLYVEAKTETTLTGTTMHASKVEIEDDGDMDIDGDEGEEIEMQGIITDITSTSFRFNGMLVQIGSLDLEDDFDLMSMTDGMMITVEGYIDANGQFVIEEIEDEHESEDEVEGTVTAKTDSSVTVLLEDSSSMTFTVNNDTRMIDEQDENNVTPLHYFSLADVLIGDFVEVEYYSVEGEHFATELERDDQPSS